MFAVLRLLLTTRMSFAEGVFWSEDFQRSRIAQARSGTFRIYHLYFIITRTVNSQIVPIRYNQGLVIGCIKRYTQIVDTEYISAYSCYVQIYCSDFNKGFEFLSWYV